MQYSLGQLHMCSEMQSRLPTITRPFDKKSIYRNNIVAKGDFNMKLHVTGWSRNVYDRTLFDFDAVNASEGWQYSYSSVQKYLVKKQINMNNISGYPPAIIFKFRLHVGESTMGGDYKADLCFSKNDVLSMFVDMFGDMPLSEVLENISAAKA